MGPVLVTSYHEPIHWDSIWAVQHQMTINGKRDKFRLHDLLAVAAQMPFFKLLVVIDEGGKALHCWREFAGIARIESQAMIDQIEKLTDCTWRNNAACIE